MRSKAMTGSLGKAITPAVAVLSGHLWLAVAAAAVPCALACITAIILVLTVESGKRVEAIKALPPLIRAIGTTRSATLPRPQRSAARTRPEAGTGGGLAPRHHVRRLASQGVPGAVTAASMVIAPAWRNVKVSGTLASFS